MSKKEKALKFRKLHVSGDPVILFNVWDAGTARAVADAGAKAIATGSLSVAAAQGYGDGQEIPLDFALQINARIVAAVDLPVTVDFEGGYANEDAALESNVQRLMTTGAVGLNFEDQIIGGEGLYTIAEQVRRIAAVRRACDASGIPAVLNARTDLFLQESNKAKHADLLDEAITRAEAYADAGADCIFVPLLSDPVLLAKFCKRVQFPVNVMVLDVAADLSPFAEAGVARISFGPSPYRSSMKRLTDAAALQLS